MAKRSSKTPIDEIAEEAIRRIREAQKETSMHAIEQQTEKPRRGPQPGRGGRPLKGAEPRQRHTIGFEPRLKAWVEARRLSGESFSDAVHRLMLQLMEQETN